jgi:hypothetical protein
LDVGRTVRHAGKDAPKNRQKTNGSRSILRTLVFLLSLRFLPPPARTGFIPATADCQRSTYESYYAGGNETSVTSTRDEPQRTQSNQDRSEQHAQPWMRLH